MKASGDVADLTDRLVHQAGEVMQLTGVARSLAIKLTGESLHGEGCTENVLTEVIVHFLADPPLLSPGRIQKCMLQKLQFGNVPDHQKVAPLARFGGPRPDIHGFRFTFLRSAGKFQSGFLGIFTLDKELLEPRFRKEDIFFARISFAASRK